MGWAAQLIYKLINGEIIKCRPRGNSMNGKIRSGQLCTIRPLNDNEILSKGDIVICKVNGNEYLYLIKAINQRKYLIRNNFGKTNG